MKFNRKNLLWGGWLPALAALGISASYSLVSCTSKNPLASAPTGSVQLNMIMQASGSAKSALLGTNTNEVYYSITGTGMAPVTGVYGPITATGNTGAVTVAIAVPQGSARLMAFQLNNASNHQALAVGALLADISTQPVSQLTVEMGSVVRNCYNQSSEAYPNGCYFNFQNESLANASLIEVTTGFDIDFLPVSGAFQLNAINGDTLAYMGNGNWVNFATAPAAGAVTNSAAAKRAAGASNTALQAGDFFCVNLGTGNGNAWLEVVNTGSASAGPSFEFRVNTALPYFAYQQTLGDAAGPCATAVPTPVPFVYTTQFGTSGSGNGQFSFDSFIAVDSASNIYVVDENNNRVEKFTGTGVFQGSFGTTGSALGQFENPSGIAVNSAGSIFVGDTGNQRVEMFNSAGTATLQWGTGGSSNGQFENPMQLALDNTGNVYVVDQGNYRVQEFTAAGIFVLAFGTQGTGLSQFESPRGVAVDSAGNIFVSDITNNTVAKFNSSGSFVAGWGGLPAGSGNGQFSQPNCLAVDSAGNVYVTDYVNYRVQEFDNNGNYLNQFGSDGTGNGQFSSPYCPAVTSTGSIYVTDNANSRVEEWVP